MASDRHNVAGLALLPVWKLEDPAVLKVAEDVEPVCIANTRFELAE